uniref:Uncharacterized protein n=1 Tax=Caenorhabditis tropicalis TaxID=1561998 RepID=A0A1I7T0E6_9PELO
MLTFILLLLVLVTAQQGYARPITSLPGPVISETTYEFSFNDTFFVTARLAEILDNVQEQELNLTVIQNCTAPATFKFGKCDVLYYQSKEDQTNFTFLFDDKGMAFLKKETERPCNGGWNPDGIIHFVVLTKEPNHCKLIFKLTGLELNFNEYSRVNSSIEQLVFYQHTPPVLIDDKDSSYVWIFSLIAVFVVVFVSILVGKCLNSDSLGDDKEDEEPKSNEDTATPDEVELESRKSSVVRQDDSSDEGSL